MLCETYVWPSAHGHSVLWTVPEKLLGTPGSGANVVYQLHSSLSHDNVMAWNRFSYYYWLVESSRAALVFSLLLAWTSCWKNSLVVGDLRRHGLIWHRCNGKNSVFVVNTLWPSDAIWRHRSGLILDQVMACCLTAPSHYLSQCWLTISEVHWHSHQDNFTSDTSVINY